MVVNRKAARGNPPRPPNVRLVSHFVRPVLRGDYTLPRRPQSNLGEIRFWIDREPFARYAIPYPLAPHWILDDCEHNPKQREDGGGGEYTDGTHPILGIVDQKIENDEHNRVDAQEKM